MNIHRRRLLAALAASVALCVPLFALAQSAAIAAPALEGRALVSALRGGGYVLYLRHTSTDFGENDAWMTDYQNCATQRNLTDKGRAEARAIGASLRELRIPIGDVLASPYCRTMETGHLAFGSVTATPAVRGGPARPDNADRYADLRRVLGTAPPPGTNVAISSHGNPFFGVAGAPYLAEGEIAVVQPQGGESFRIVARVRWDEWAALTVTR